MQTLPEPEGLLIHDRGYSVRSYRLGPERLMLRGTVHDQKPPGIYFEEDKEWLDIHHMVVDLTVDFPSLEILEVEVTMGVIPHSGCTSIEPDYQQLVGLSIARGFGRKLKDLFGGPRGCTHVGALLQAMAPVAVQSSWSMRALADELPGDTGSEVGNGQAPKEDPKGALRFNLNTCHIWAEDGPQVAGVLAGKEMEVPLWAQERIQSLGRKTPNWKRSN